MANLGHIEESKYHTTEIEFLEFLDAYNEENKKIRHSKCREYQRESLGGPNDPLHRKKAEGGLVRREDISMVIAEPKLKEDSMASMFDQRLSFLLLKVVKSPFLTISKSPISSVLVSDTGDEEKDNEKY